MARKSKVDERAAKEKKQKKIAAVGGVLLLVVMGIQVPRTMKMLNQNSAAATPPPAATTAPTPAPATGAPADPLAPPSLSTANPSAPAAPVSAGPVAAAGQLISFSRFESKDPFVQQVDPDVAAEAKPEAGKDPDADKPEGAPLEPDGGADPGTTPAAPTSTSAHISVNGAEETVSVDAVFPQATPTFVLVSVAAKSAKIKVAEGGSFAAGDATLTLELKKPVTLVNTADGTRYVLELRSVP